MDGSHFPISPRRFAGHRAATVVTTAALDRPDVMALHDCGRRLVVVGDDPILMGLAGGLCPNAERAWVNLCAMHALKSFVSGIAETGGCDHLIHSGTWNLPDDPRALATETLAATGLILAFLPLMKGRNGARIALSSFAPPVRASLKAMTDAMQQMDPALPAFVWDQPCDAIRASAARPAPGHGKDRPVPTQIH